MFEHCPLLSFIIKPKHHVHVALKRHTILFNGPGKPVAKWISEKDKLTAARRKFTFVLQHMYGRLPHNKQIHFFKLPLVRMLTQFYSEKLFYWILNETDHFFEHRHHAKYVCELLAARGHADVLQTFYVRFGTRASVQAANQAADAGFLDVLRIMANMYRPAVTPSRIMVEHPLVIQWIQQRARIIRCKSNRMIIVAPLYLKPQIKK